MRTLKSQLEAPVQQWRDTPQLWQLRRACIQNSLELLKEARILRKHRRYARAFALAHMAYEEFGKGQIVSDYITGVASEEEFWSAFRSHELKASYNRRKIVLHMDRSRPPTVEYDQKSARDFFRLRMDALYVDCAKDYTPSIPKALINSKEAKAAIDQVTEYIGRVLWAEHFNERIGTKALAK
jgi:AbiV family abortive infection protein